LYSAASPIQTTVCGTTESSKASVYAFADYSITLRNAIYVENCKDDGNLLTDLKYSSIEPEKNIYDGWAGFKSADGATDYRVTVTIDLGYIAQGICDFFARVYRNRSISAETPTEIKFYVSEDGSDYSYIGSGQTLTGEDSDETSVTYTLSSSSSANGRYIRAVINCRGAYKLYINEIGAAARGNIFRANYSKYGYYIDHQGLQYKITNGKAEIIGFTKEASGYSGSLTPSEADFNKDGSRYTLGLGGSNEVSVISDFIGADRLNYSGTPNNIQYIVIHNTGTIEEETDAERYNYRMHNTDNELSWHYTVDDSIIYHSLADNIAGWHAGSKYNYQSIGIEICVNGAPTNSNGDFVFTGEKYNEWVENRFRKSLKNAAMLTAELLTRYGLDTDSVIQHHDTTDKNCPMWLRYKNGKFVDNGVLWTEFLGYVQEYYHLLNGSSAEPKIQPLSKITIPDYIIDYNGGVYPVDSIGHIAFCKAEGAINIITLGKQITSISPDGLTNSGIYRITVPDANKSFYTDSEGNLYNSDNVLIYSPNSDLPDIVPAPKEESDLNISEKDGNYYLLLKKPTSIEEIAESYGAEITRAYTKGGSSIYGSIKPSTGAVIVFEDGAKVTVALLGDIDGDGRINGLDYTKAKRQCFGSYDMTYCEFLAASITESDTICSMDYLYLKRHCFKTFNIYE